MIGISRIEFKKLTWAAFKAEYRTAVQPKVEWGRIRNPKMGLSMQVDGDFALYMPWYTGGDWRDGEPRLVPKGSATALVRVPAVLTGNGKLLVLDGCHRLTQLRPRVVVVDWFHPAKYDRRYLNDLFNENFW